MARRGGSAEIAALKQAEAEAQQLVNAAREERKLKLRQAQQDAKREIDEYRALRESKLRSVQPEVRLEEDIRKVTCLKPDVPHAGPSPWREDSPHYVRHESYDSGP
jgi:hypothetical protein